MILKSEIEKIITNDLIKVINAEIIYKYASFDISLYEIILKQSLQFSNPEIFNDPFDCNEKLLKINYDENIIEQAINDLSINISRKERRELKRKFENQNNQNRILKEKRKEYKLSCFSEYYDEILMWSHYAEKHSGICVGFNFPHNYEEKFILCPVKYFRELKELDGTTDVYRIILYWLTTKSIRWQYEKENRAITKSKNKDLSYEYIKYDSKYIKEIIFGVNVSGEKINKAITLIKKSNINYKRIIFKRMRINENNFLLTEEIIEIIAQ